LVTKVGFQFTACDWYILNINKFQFTLKNLNEVKWLHYDAMRSLKFVYGDILKNIKFIFEESEEKTDFNLITKYFLKNL
jgi:hypothetical protein